MHTNCMILHWYNKKHMIIFWQLANQPSLCRYILDRNYTMTEKGATLFLPLTLSNANQFSKSFHLQALQ